MSDDPSSHAYFGAEFCEALMPSRSALLAASRRHAAGSFTYVTPPVGEAALSRLQGHLELLATEGRPVEVVVNDWGALRLVRATSPLLRPVLGRLLNRMLRDPRVTPLFDTDVVTAAAAEASRQNAFTSPGYAAHLRAHGVEVVELDNLYQGIDIDFAEVGLRPALHVPFGVVASGPACFFAGIHQPKHEKFMSETPCQLECRTYAAQMTDPDASRPQPPLRAQGNTVFYRHDAALMERGLAWAERWGARVVVRQDPLGEGRATTDVALARRWLEEDHG